MTGTERSLERTRRAQRVIGSTARPNGTTRRTLWQRYWVITVPTFVVESESGTAYEAVDKSRDVGSVANLEALT